MSFKNKNSQDELARRAENLFNALQKNTNSIFYLAGNTISKTLINKASKSVFEKDRVFVDLYKQLEDKESLKKVIYYLLQRPFMNSKVMWITRLFLVSLSLLSYYMAILEIRDFLPDLRLIQSIAFFWLIYLLQRYIFIL